MLPGSDAADASIMHADSVVTMGKLLRKLRSRRAESDVVATNIQAEERYRMYDRILSKHWHVMVR